MKQLISIGKRRIQPTYSLTHWVLVFLMSMLTVADKTNAAESTAVWQRWEQTLKSFVEYRNPFKDVTVSVTYSGPDKETFKSLAFWDGNSTFKIRCAFPAPGTWSWQTTCSDTANKGLHSRHGKVDVQPSVEAIRSTHTDSSASAPTVATCPTPTEPLSCGWAIPTGRRPHC